MIKEQRERIKEQRAKSKEQRTRTKEQGKNIFTLYAPFFALCSLLLNPYALSPATHLHQLIKSDLFEITGG